MALTEAQKRAQNRWRAKKKTKIYTLQNSI